MLRFMNDVTKATQDLSMNPNGDVQQVEYPGGLGLPNGRKELAELIEENWQIAEALGTRRFPPVQPPLLAGHKRLENFQQRELPRRSLFWFSCLSWQTLTRTLLIFTATRTSAGVGPRLPPPANRLATSHGSGMCRKIFGSTISLTLKPQTVNFAF